MRRTRGFTLIEQMVVLAIVLVLLAMAVPAFGTLVRGERLRVAQTSLLGALRFARTTAVMTSRRILFCPTRDGRRCSGDTQWEHGWLVGTDRDRDSQPDGPPLRTGLDGTGLTIRSSIARRHVTYLPDGSAGGTNLTLVLCAPDQPPLTVVVSNWGRIRGARATAHQAADCPPAGGG